MRTWHDDHLDMPPEPVGQGCARILLAALIVVGVLSALWLARGR